MVESGRYRGLAPSCAVAMMLACTAVLSAQKPLVGRRLPEVDGFGSLRVVAGALPPARAEGRGQVQLWAFLPAARTAYLAAESLLVRLEREIGPGLAIVALLTEAGADALLAARGRGPRGSFARAVDGGDRLRGALLGGADGSVGAGAGYVLLDRQRHVLRAGRLHSGVRHELRDTLAGRLDLHLARRWAGITGAERAGSDDPAAARRPTHAHHRPWIEHLESLSSDRELGDGALSRELDAALRALDGRPEFQVRVLQAVAERFPGELGGPGVPGILQAAVAGLRRDAAVQRAGFVCYAVRGEVSRARSCGFAWLESCKGVPGRAAELLEAVDAAPGGAQRYPELVRTSLAVGLAAQPGDRALLRRAFDHDLATLGDTAATRRAGERYVTALGTDAQALNSFAWALLTRRPYAGRCDALALVAARAMAEDPQWRVFWRVDTLALACFRNGRIDEAIRLQREALQGADASAAPRYRERLERYLASSR